MAYARRRFGWMAAFVAGGMAVDAQEPQRAVLATPKAPASRKPRRAQPGGALERFSSFGGGNIALLAGLLVMPIVVGAGLATDPEWAAGIHMRTNIAVAAPQTVSLR